MLKTGAPMDVAREGSREAFAAEALRVGFLVDDFPVLSETFVVEQARGLLRRSVDVRVLVASPSCGEAFDAASGVDAEFRHRVLRARRGGVWADAIDTIGRRPAGAPFLLGAVAMEPPAWRTILGRDAAFSGAPAFDVLHCQFAPLGLLALRHRATGALRYRRLVTHLRGYDITKFVEERGRHVYDRLFRTGDLFIANCRYFADRAMALGCDPARIAVIGSPVDVAFFAPPADPRPPRPAAAPLRIAAVGRLVEKKGFDDAIGAVARLAASGVDARLEVIGDGPLRSRLEASVEAEGLGGRVSLPGAAGRDAVRALLWRSDLLVAPSVRARSGDEDAPVNTLKEAMAVGLPVVATRHGGIPELVEDGVHGALAPERDPAALAAAIRRVADASEEERRAMGAAARARVVADYGSDAIISRTLEAYAKAVAEGGRPCR